MFRKKGIDYLIIIEDIEIIKKHTLIVVNDLVECITFITLLFSFNLLSKQGENIDFDSFKQSFLNANYIFFRVILLYRLLYIPWYDKHSLGTKFIGNILGFCFGGILFIKSIDELLQFRIEPFLAFYFNAFLLLIFLKLLVFMIKSCIEVYARKENRL